MLAHGFPKTVGASSLNHPTEVNHEKEKRANNSGRKKETA
jgi:hypothetical protein